jgi:hypothetical protein
MVYLIAHDSEFKMVSPPDVPNCLWKRLQTFLATTEYQRNSDRENFGDPAP